MQMKLEVAGGVGGLDNHREYSLKAQQIHNGHGVVPCSYTHKHTHTK